MFKSTATPVSFKPGISLLALSQGAPVYAPIATFDARSEVTSPSGVPAAWSGGLHLLPNLALCPLYAVRLPVENDAAAGWSTTFMASVLAASGRPVSTLASNLLANLGFAHPIGKRTLSRRQTASVVPEYRKRLITRRLRR